VAPSESWLWSEIVFQAIAAVEEFGDVSADSVVNHKPTSWVVFFELRNIKYQVIKNHQLLSFPKSFFKLVKCDYQSWLYEGNFLRQNILVSDFKDSKNGDKTNKLGSCNRDPLFCKAKIVYDRKDN